ncbi:MAG: M56 family metallopeptidase [Phycisphaerae bacterium]|nr:M56 family metallopeptidase [Phycisphaerae bacterium]
MNNLLPSIHVSNTLTILLDASLRGALIFALTGAVSWMLRKRSAAVRHSLWASAVALALLLPIFSAVLPSWRWGVLPEVQPTASGPVAAQPTDSTTSARRSLQKTLPTASPAEEVVASTNEPATISPEPAVAAAEHQPVEPAAVPVWRTISLSTWLLVLWALGVAWMLLSMLTGTVGIRRVARKSEHITDPAILAMKDRLCEELDIRSPVLMLQSKESFVPVTWGIWWPTVLLPREAKDWSRDRLRMVLLHELAHIKRGDCLVQLLVQLARAIYWFHPLVWWASKNLRIQRERACDDLVLAGGIAGADYADQLLQIVRSYRSGKGTPLAAVAMARKSQFESRLLSVLDTARRRGGLSRTVAWSLLAVALAVAVPVAALQPVAKAKPNDGNAFVSEKTTSSAKSVGVSQTKLKTVFLPKSV